MDNPRQLQVLLKMVNFSTKLMLITAYSRIGKWSTGKTIPFSRKDDGGDLVETSYLFQGLLSAAIF